MISDVVANKLRKPGSPNLSSSSAHVPRHPQTELATCPGMSSRPSNTGSSGEDSDSDDNLKDTKKAAIRPGTAIALRNDANWLGTTNKLQETDVIILLTPIVNPIDRSETPSDPFEPLGRAFATRHGRIRHVPYSRKLGINSAHLGFIQRGQLIIFCLVPSEGSLQLTHAEIAFAARENCPFILIAFCDTEMARAIPLFPALIQTDSYLPYDLEAVASLLFERHNYGPGQTLTTSVPPSRLTPGTSQTTPIASSLTSPRLWPVEEWDEARDISEVWGLWTNAVRTPFTINQGTLSLLLRRPGYAKHYVVRQFDVVLGFCATYLSYIDKAGENLIASIAILVVHPLYRKQGIGLSLHSHSVIALRRTRGITRLQLGSTFPRILYGPLVDMAHEEWFRRRGWILDRHNGPGKGHKIYDLLLEIADWRLPMAFPESRVSFRLCKQEDMPQVLQIVENTPRMCWFDQYSCLMNGPNVKDIVLAVAETKVIAVALTYTPFCGSQVAANLPWASQIGDDVGGITCICVSPNDESSVEFGLLNACVRTLQRQGMRRVFLDGVMEGLEHLKNTGFQEWAVYKDVVSTTSPLPPIMGNIISSSTS